MKALVTGKLVGEVEYRDTKPFANFEINTGDDDDPVYVRVKVWELNIANKLKQELGDGGSWLTVAGSLKLDDFNDTKNLEVGASRFIVVEESGEPGLRVKAEGILTQVSADGTSGTVSAGNGGRKENDQWIDFFCDVRLLADGTIARKLKDMAGHQVRIEGPMTTEADFTGDIESMCITVERINGFGKPSPIPARKPPAPKRVSSSSSVDLNDEIPFAPQWK
jgi:hypothetical protein